jgi:hypothetical protein
LLQSNEWTGKESFFGRSLHHLGPNPNPYEQAMMIIGKTLASFDDDQLIPAYGFGDGEASSTALRPQLLQRVQQCSSGWHSTYDLGSFCCASAMRLHALKTVTTSSSKHQRGVTCPSCRTHQQRIAVHVS